MSAPSMTPETFCQVLLFLNVKLSTKKITAKSNITPKTTSRVVLPPGVKTEAVSVWSGFEGSYITGKVCPAVTEL